MTDEIIVNGAVPNVRRVRTEIRVIGYHGWTPVVAIARYVTDPIPAGAGAGFTVGAPEDAAWDAADVVAGLR